MQVYHEQQQVQSDEEHCQLAAAAARQLELLSAT